MIGSTYLGYHRHGLWLRKMAFQLKVLSDSSLPFLDREYGEGEDVEVALGLVWGDEEWTW